MSLFDSEYRSREHAILGTVPESWQGSTALDGAAAPWSSAGVGSMYLYRVSSTDNRVYVKVLSTGATTDWIVLTSSNQTKGVIQVPLATLRETGSSAIPNAAGIGGLLASDTTPILNSINADTDGALRLTWASSNSDGITFQVVLPDDFDDTGDVLVKFRAAMAGTTDTPTFTLDTYFNEGDTQVADASGAVTGATYATYTATIATADVPAARTMTVEVIPGAHTTDALYCTAIWVEYTKK